MSETLKSHETLMDTDSGICMSPPRGKAYPVPPKVIIEKLDEWSSVTCATVGSVGWDVTAIEEVILYNGQVTKVRTGIKMELPEGYECQVRPRSGLSSKGVVITNSPGTIDSDYRGEVCILMSTLGDSYRIKPGDRIAQFVFQYVPRLDVTFGRVTENTERGAGGFGSTGK